MYFANEFLYFEFQTLELLALLMSYLAFYCAVGNRLWEEGAIMVWFNMVYVLSSTGRSFLAVMAVVIGWLIVVKVFYFWVLIYSIIYNYTLDELWNPQYYPYLFKPAANIPSRFYYRNDADKGIMANIKEFIAQAVSKKPLPA